MRDILLMLAYVQGIGNLLWAVLSAKSLHKLVMRLSEWEIIRSWWRLVAYGFWYALLIGGLIPGVLSAVKIASAIFFSQSSLPYRIFVGFRFTVCRSFPQNAFTYLLSFFAIYLGHVFVDEARF